MQIVCYSLLLLFITAGPVKSIIEESNVFWAFVKITGLTLSVFCTLMFLSLLSDAKKKAREQPQYEIVTDTLYRLKKLP